MMSLSKTAAAAMALLVPMAAPALAQQAAGESVVAIKGVDGTDHGTVTLRQTPQGMLLVAALKGVPDGEHSFHVHEKGLCEAKFESAGGHFNPDGKAHGYMAEGGPHAGDMPNFTATGGTANFQVFNPMIGSGSAALDDADGSSLVIHSGADDYVSQPAGKAGDRIACGVIHPAN